MKLDKATELAIKYKQAVVAIVYDYMAGSDETDYVVTEHVEATIHYAIHDEHADQAFVLVDHRISPTN